jgi:hypothetical protein
MTTHIVTISTVKSWLLAMGWKRYFVLSEPEVMGLSERWGIKK